MNDINKEEIIKERIIEAIRIIENIKETYRIDIKAYPKTIYSFIFKYKSSYFYKYFKKYDVFNNKSLIKITKTQIQIGLNSLIKENKIKKIEINNITCFYVLNDTKAFILCSNILKQFSNINNAKTYMNVDFERLANWDNVLDISLKESINDKYIEYRNRKLFYASKYERIMINYLIKYKLIKNIGTQNLCINYSSKFSKNKKYFPDIVILTIDGYIGIIEVKETIEMTYHLNIDKYNELKKYCESNGYLYMMVDPINDYLTFEELKNIEVNDKVVKIVQDWITTNKNTNKYFDNNDINKWYEEIEKENISKKKFKEQIASLIIKNGLYNVSNKHSFKVYGKAIKIEDERNYSTSS